MIDILDLVQGLEETRVKGVDILVLLWIESPNNTHKSCHGSLLFVNYLRLKDGGRRK